MLLSWDCIIKNLFKNLPGTYFLTSDRMSLFSSPSSNGWNIPLIFRFSVGILFGWYIVRLWTVYRLPMITCILKIPWNQKVKNTTRFAVFRSRNRNNLYGSGSFHQHAKKMKKNLDFYSLWLLNNLISLTTDVKVPTVNTSENLKKIIFRWHRESHWKKRLDPDP